MTVDERISALISVAEQHESEIQMHTEWLTGLSRGLQDLTAQMKAGFAEVNRQFAEVNRQFTDVNGKIDILVTSVASLAASQKKTDETLQAFIRSLQKGGNGSTA